MVSQSAGKYMETGIEHGVFAIYNIGIPINEEIALQSLEKTFGKTSIRD